MIRSYKFGIDLDGTLIDSPPFNFKVDDLDDLVERSRCFHAKKGIEILSEMDLDVTIITGRGKSFRKNTIEWLVEHNVVFSELLMIGDYADNTFDVELYLKHKLDAYLSRKIHFALDDDINVVNMLTKYDIRAVKVDEDFREAFDKLFK